MDADDFTERLKLTPQDAAVEIAMRSIVCAATYGRRVVVGLAGGPGSGKSTLTAEVIAILNRKIDGSAARVPMDGFYLPHAQLQARGLAAVKGSPETFDARGFIDFLKKIKASKTPIAVPSYSRRIDDVVPDAFTISGNVPILVVEGNYLLLDRATWLPVRDLLDVKIFIVVDRKIVRRRLIARRGASGRYTKQDILEHVDKVEMDNYDAVNATNGNADIVIELITES